ncbi:hypothetical protein WN48_04766 [Eufriesea mexicana]|uniref:Uncharacterized protein n=1 Tax=Eufriesea mexicana TaxID=516756 RepID=A0A310SLX8_9HYME|nr:hypothetical protein WN48_04766 [Eufriesea mexicana]
MVINIITTDTEIAVAIAITTDIAATININIVIKIITAIDIAASGIIANDIIVTAMVATVDIAIDENKAATPGTVKDVVITISIDVQMAENVCYNGHRFPAMAASDFPPAEDQSPREEDPTPGTREPPLSMEVSNVAFGEKSVESKTGRKRPKLFGKFHPSRMGRDSWIFHR